MALPCPPGAPLQPRAATREVAAAHGAGSAV